jgi:hypothetical protein
LIGIGENMVTSPAAIEFKKVALLRARKELADKAAFCDDIYALEKAIQAVTTEKTMDDRTLSGANNGPND